jgi:hypothetical protein
MSVSTFENEWVKIEHHKKYLYVYFKENNDSELNIEAAKKIIEDSLSFTNGVIFPVINDIKNMPTHNREVREYFAGQASRSAKANAILVSSTFNRVIASFFLSLNKPLIPTKIFSDRNKAVEWLQKYS